MRRRVKKTLQWIGLGWVVLVLIGVAGFLTLNESLPSGESPASADAKAQAMLMALNVAGWDKVDRIEWTFDKRHQLDWDKKKKSAIVEWSAKKVKIDLEQQTGEVLTPELNSAADHEKLVRTAFKHFNNDSFWLAAPFKVFDPGTERSLVTLEDGRTGLKVTYTQGGNTPGDSYVWLLDSDNRPVSLKLWVSIIPVGGLEVSWENYRVLDSGAMIAMDHYVNRWMNVDLSELRTY